MCRSISRAVETLLLAMASHSKLSFVRFLQIVLNIALSIVLGLQYGIEGILVATIISFYFCDVVLHILLYRKYTGYPIKMLLTKFVVTNILAVSICYVGFNLKLNLQPYSWIDLALASVVAFFTCVIVFWMAIVDKESKQLVLATISENAPGLLKK